MDEKQEEEITTSKNEQQGLGCFTLVVIGFFIFWIGETIFFITHPPFNIMDFSFITLLFAGILFLYSPLGRAILSKYPILAKSSTLIYVLSSFYLLFRQIPFNSPAMLFSLLLICIYLFMQTPSFRYVLRWFHLVLILLIFIGGAINIYPLIFQHPINYGKIVSILAICIGLVIFLLLSRKILQHMAVQVQEGTVSSTKPIMEFHLLGVSVLIFRSGKVTISNNKI